LAQVVAAGVVPGSAGGVSTAGSAAAGSALVGGAPVSAGGAALVTPPPARLEATSPAPKPGAPPPAEATARGGAADLAGIPRGAWTRTITGGPAAAA
jgi:hypothetical protein